MNKSLSSPIWLRALSMCFQKITHVSVWWPRPPEGPGVERLDCFQLHPFCSRSLWLCWGEPWGCLRKRSSVILSAHRSWAGKELRAAYEASGPARRPGEQGRALFSSDDSPHLGFLKWAVGAGRITYWSSNNPAGCVFNEGHFSAWSWGLVDDSAGVAKPACGIGMSCMLLRDGMFSQPLLSPWKGLWSRHIIEMCTSLM